MDLLHSEGDLWQQIGTFIPHSVQPVQNDPYLIRTLSVLCQIQTRFPVSKPDITDAYYLIPFKEHCICFSMLSVIFK